MTHSPCQILNIPFLANTYDQHQNSPHEAPCELLGGSIQTNTSLYKVRHFATTLLCVLLVLTDFTQQLSGRVYHECTESHPFLPARDVSRGPQLPAPDFI